MFWSHAAPTRKGSEGKRILPKELRPKVGDSRGSTGITESGFVTSCRVFVWALLPADTSLVASAPRLGGG